ncbi:MAG: hypothetical protein FJZ04_00625 [Candidatus Moranbacteria bacterium]|nr:hypothetical protein [Candidatus Moranbacteria bacterium]
MEKLKWNYEKYSFSLTRSEVKLREQLLYWLPEKIIDSHSHINVPNLITSHDFLLSHPASTFLDFDLKKSTKLNQILFPGRFVKSLFIPCPFVGIDFYSSNKYFKKQINQPDRFAIMGIPDEVDYTVKAIKSSKCAALKMYPWQTFPPYSHIYDFFRPEILEFCQNNKTPIILHLPRRIEEITNEVKQLMIDFPKLIVVLAHLGVPSYESKNIEKDYREIKKYPNLFFDTALVISSLIIGSALKVFGYERLLFGTDAPINMIRGILYQNPQLGERMASAYPYHWVDYNEYVEYGYLAKNATHLHWQALLSLREAIEKMYPRCKSVLDSIFFKNAKNVYFF